MSYPPATIPTRVDGQTIEAAHVNVIKTAIEAIVAELGADPSGTSATLQARLTEIETALAALTAGDPPAVTPDTYIETYLETY